LRERPGIADAALAGWFEPWTVLGSLVDRKRVTQSEDFDLQRRPGANHERDVNRHWRVPPLDLAAACGSAIEISYSAAGTSGADREPGSLDLTF
jgi:hypothetical protein